MTTEDMLIEMGRRWREANPDLARKLLLPHRSHGKPGVGKHGAVYNIPNDPNRREPWSAQEDAEITASNAPSLSVLRARLGRSKAAILSRRWALQQGKGGRT